jgi:hypothetical protein
MNTAFVRVLNPFPTFGRGEGRWACVVVACCISFWYIPCRTQASQAGRPRRMCPKHASAPCVHVAPRAEDAAHAKRASVLSESVHGSAADTLIIKTRKFTKITFPCSPNDRPCETSTYALHLQHTETTSVSSFLNFSATSTTYQNIFCMGISYVATQRCRRVSDFEYTTSSARCRTGLGDVYGDVRSESRSSSSIRSLQNLILRNCSN